MQLCFRLPTIFRYSVHNHVDNCQPADLEICGQLRLHIRSRRSKDRHSSHFTRFGAKDPIYDARSNPADPQHSCCGDHDAEFPAPCSSSHWFSAFRPDTTVMPLNARVSHTLAAGSTFNVTERMERGARDQARCGQLWGKEAV